MIQSTESSVIHQVYPAITNWCGEFSAPVHLRGRCSSRVCYSTKTTSSGDRSFGHFVADADALARAVLNQVGPGDIESPDSWEGSLYRWLRNCDRHNDELTTLPSEWRGIEAAIEQAFLRGEARVFCVCCNRSYQRPETQFEQGLSAELQIANRYFCPKGHLLMQTPSEGQLSAVASIAA